MSQAMKHAKPIGAKPMTEEERQQAVERMLAQKLSAFFEGILYNTIQAGTFGKDLNAAVDAALEAAHHAIEGFYAIKKEDKEEAK